MAAVALGLAVLGGCAASPAADEAAGSPATLTVYAAASLQAAFDEIADDFETAHPEIDILPLVYDGSSTLATQIVEGASPDVFASADEANMRAVQDAGLGDPATVFATNTLVIAVPEGNPAGIMSLPDLSDPGATVVLCAPEVPCGHASAQLLERAGVDLTPASLEQSVTAVATKVAVGEADAGLIYTTDVATRSGIEAITPQGADAVVNRYPIAALAGSRHPEAAQAFVDFVTGPEGRDVLARYGFGAP
ncbi:molybdate ABC transporter substrate-binding protein [Microbacterium sp. LRZ72]|uniref:molybdate ABC transporter substrate-binding protein n=1 Tax=Microbacterium sp. LRZ72 TaxID=2942481 RepID=UPI0029A516D6|nr:molybdate ABC transporter substrate-binding protein [Microbacterium sp. LRZ72]MDX2376852.1 molybdate ABC transporter substrate-binding protein [Microbacterium sp. LRZ72]